MNPPPAAHPGNVHAEIRQLIAALSDPVGPSEARAQARRLAGHVLGLPWVRIAFEPEMAFSVAQLATWREAARRLLAGEPLQYITGVAWFMDLAFEVGPGALIPRPETEELVAWVLEDFPAGRPCRGLDVGTGSGCIAVALAAARPQAEIYAVDLSADALAIARRNAARHGAQVQFRELDIRTAPEEAYAGLDFIVSNPPYIPEAERAGLQPQVRDHEPGLALFVPDGFPLLYYNKVSALARHYLRPGGKLYFEVHESFGKEVAEALRSAGFSSVSTRNDINQKLRMASGTLKSP